MSQGAPVIQFEGVYRWYSNVIGLKNFTAEIQPGLIGLLGPNGAGKTTFLRLVTGTIRPNRGRVRVLGEPVFNNPRLMRRIGYAPEADAFYEFLTGREFVTKLVQLHGFDRRRSRDLAEAALAKVDLLEVCDRKIYTYSRGMRQRLKIAQSIAHEPEIYFMDEPLNGLDPLQRKRVKDLFRQLGREGKTVLISSHVLHEVEAVTKNFLLVHKGRLVAQGDVHEIRNLIDKHPHSIVLSTDDPRRLAGAFYGLDSVRALEFGPGTLKVLTHEPEAFYRGLPAILLASGVAIREFHSPDDNLEAVFRYLVES